MGLRDRLRRGRPRDPADVVAELRRTIGRLDEQRRLVARAGGRVLVSRVEVARLCSDQLAALARARAEAEHATATAERAAARARAEGSAETPQYEATAAALRASQDVLAAAAAPVHALLAGATADATRTREVLARSREVLDAQLREQVRELRAFERAESARVVAEARRRPR